MKERILNYRKSIDKLLENPDANTDWAQIMKTHLNQVAFFQHERLIHLIVTALVAILMVICFSIAMLGEKLIMFVLVFALLVLLIPYLGHYYLLENEVQKMYGQYDKIEELLLKSEQTEKY